MRQDPKFYKRGVMQMEELVRKVNVIWDTIAWLTLIGAGAVVYHICKDLGAELYYLFC